MYGNCKTKEKDRSNDLVRQEFKRFKKKRPTPDFSSVVDFSSPERFKDLIERITPTDNSTCQEACLVGLISPSEWTIYELKPCPGILFIGNPFQNGAQKYWATKALTDYTKKPYPVNLDVHIELDPDMTVWDISKMKCEDDPYCFMEKLRWSHLGYHFDYNIVTYKEEKYYGFPNDLSLLMTCIAKRIGYPSYVPETAIINYYPLGSSMGGHTDHYEEELDQPLISVSFGQPAVFLIGGPTRDIRPTAVWIRSGDILVMSGPSRTAFHAVPCIVKIGKDGEPPDELKLVGNYEFTNSSENGHDYAASKTELMAPEQTEKLYNGCDTDKITVREHRCRNCQSPNLDHCWKDFRPSETEWRPFADYLSKTRININVRQVHRTPKQYETSDGVL